MKIFFGIAAILNMVVAVLSFSMGHVPEATYFLVFSLIFIYLADREQS
jgi:hypothetical protein